MTDINDNPPKFDRRDYDVTIEEDHAVDKEIVSIKAFDLDEGNNRCFTYSLANSYGNKFVLDSSKNPCDPNNKVIIRLGEKLDTDREQNIYHLNVSATDQGEPPLS